MFSLWFGSTALIPGSPSHHTVIPPTESAADASKNLPTLRLSTDMDIINRLFYLDSSMSVDAGENRASSS